MKSITSIAVIGLFFGVVHAFTIHPSTSLSRTFRPRLSALTDNTLSCRLKQSRIPSRSSSSSIQMNGLGDAWQSYVYYLDTYPIVVKCITAGIIMPLGDLSAQVIETSKKNKDAAALASLNGSEVGPMAGVDWPRFIRFFIFGASLQPIWNHFYFQILDTYLPPPAVWYDPINGLKVVLDQFVQAPIFTAIIFAFLGTLEGKSLDQIKTQLNRDFIPTMTANWKVWVPVTMINMAFLPPDLRVGFVNCVFFGWSIFLSLVINKKQEVEEISSTSSRS